MKIFKTRYFDRWSKHEDLSDQTLNKVTCEIEKGLVDANLGGNVVKKRIAAKGRGKSGGLRTIIAFNIKDKAIFLYGFSKNKQDNITMKDQTAFKKLAKEYFSLSDKEFLSLVEDGTFIEVQS